MDVRSVSRVLTIDTVEAAYRRGLFPMAHPPSKVITWHCPARRAILPLYEFHLSRSLERTIRLARFSVRFDTAFEKVIRACANRPSEETWISEEIIGVYCSLHRAGKAHSVEVWVDGELVGGLYGVHLGGAFFAESKFHRVRDMSKVALAGLVFRLRERGFALLEVQYLTPHLARLGAREISHREYMALLSQALEKEIGF